ncbi:MAG: hypothetical protein ACTSPY_17230 [Candidatus Helarchaeota archaeon]
MANNIRDNRYIKKLREKKYKNFNKSLGFYWILSIFLGLCIDLINGFFLNFIIFPLYIIFMAIMPALIFVIHGVIIHFNLKRKIKNLGNLKEPIRVSKPNNNNKILYKKRGIKESLKHLFFDFFDLESIRFLGVKKKNFDRFITKKHFICMISAFIILYFLKIYKGFYGFCINNDIISFPEYLYEVDFLNNDIIAFNNGIYIIMYGLIIPYFYNILIYELYISKIEVEDKVLIRIIKALNKFNLVLFVLSFNYVLLSCIYFFYIIDIYEKVILFEHMLIPLLYVISNFIYLDSTLYITDRIKEEVNNDIKLKKSINRITTINIILNYLFLASAFLISLIYHLMVYMITSDIYIVDIIRIYFILFLIVLFFISFLTSYIIKRKKKIMGNL